MSAGQSTADWNALGAVLAGELLLPGTPGYELARPPAMARFAQIGPVAIARCRTSEDVAEALTRARRLGLDVAVRAGGHCFEGRSSTRGLLIDVGSMDGVSLADGVVTAGAGVKLGALYDALDEHGRTIAAGCGPTVGIAGLVLGGGCGILGRRHGLTCDQLLAAEVVLADGRVVWCDEQRHPDLFWGLRGAGGARFGVLTRVVLETVPAPDATILDLRWPQHDAAAVIAAWQQWAPDAPDEVAASLLVTAGSEPEEPLAVRAFGAVVSATESGTRTILDGLVERAGAEPDASSLTHGSYRQAKRLLAAPGQEPAAKPDPGHVFAKSEFFRGPLPADAITALVGHLIAGRIPGESRELDFTPWGAGYNRVRPDAGAFAHRGERFLLKHEAVVAAEQAEALTPGAREWLTRSWALAHPAGGGGAYPNFPDPDLGTWDRAYHGANLDRLLEVKADYDPDGAFGDPAPAAG